MTNRRWMPDAIGLLGVIGLLVGSACQPASHTRDAGTEHDAGVVADAGGGPVVPLCWPISASTEMERSVDLTPAITSADVYFLVDVTASMGEEIDQLRAAIVDTVIPGIRAAVPDVEIAVGEFADFPVSMYGDAGDVVLLMRQTATADASAATLAVNALTLRNGLDRPESLVEALYLSITGESLGSFVPAASCPAGRLGHPCFRADAVPIVVVLTDAPTHNGPGGSNPYTGIFPAPHTFEEAIAALGSAGARVVTLYSGEGEGREDVVALATATSSTRRDGSPLVFDVGTGGRDVPAAAVDAIRDLAAEATMRVTLSVEDIDGDADDAAAWFAASRLESVEPPEARIATAGEVVEVLPRARLSYAVSLLPPGALPSQTQRVRIALREQSGSLVAAAEVDLPDAATGCP